MHGELSFCGGGARAARNQEEQKDEEEADGEAGEMPEEE